MDKYRIARLNAELEKTAKRVRMWAERGNLAKMDEAAAWLNGLREAAEILGYSIRYIGNIPQIDYEDNQDVDLTEDEIRKNWEAALNALPYDEISHRIGWGFDDDDLTELMRLHKANVHREKIEDLLEDCNYHYECGEWHNGNYVVRED